MKNDDPTHNLDFHEFEGFSCYYSSAATTSAVLEWPAQKHRHAEAHQQVEILVLLEHVIAKLFWHSAQGDRQKTITAGQICIIPRQQQQLIHNQSSPFMAILIMPQLIAEAAHQTLRTPQWSFRGEYGIEDETVLSLAKALRHWLTKKSAIAALYRRSLAKLLAVHLIANYAQADFKQEEGSEFVCDAKLIPVLKYIHSNLDQELRVAALAERSELSQSHFCRVFKKSVGIPPYRYILYRRITRSKTLLLETNLALTDISFQCGFYDQSHFILQFRRFTGTTPKAYREDAKTSKKALEAKRYSTQRV